MTIVECNNVFEDMTGMVHFFTFSITSFTNCRFECKCTTIPCRNCTKLNGGKVQNEFVYNIYFLDYFSHDI